MTKEQEVIEYFKKQIESCSENADICDDNNFNEEAAYLRKQRYMYKTVLNMLNKYSADSAEKDKIIAEKSAEIEKLKTDFKIVDQECSRLERKEAKQDKMIDLMAEELQTHMFVVSVSKTIIGKKGIKEKKKKKAVNDV